MCAEFAMEITALNLPGSGTGAAAAGAGAGAGAGTAADWPVSRLMGGGGGGRRRRWRRLERRGGEPGLVAATVEDDVAAVFDEDVFVVAAGQDADFAACIGQGVDGGLDGGVLSETFY